MNFEKEFDELKAKMTPVNTGKFLMGTLVSCGAMAAVVGALRLPVATSRGLTKLMMRLGIFMLGCKAGEVAEKYFNEMFDNIVNALKESGEEKKNEPDADKQ